MIKIYDLDNTVIDSVHRQCTLPDGTLDLVHWVANNTAELIEQDSTLPLVHTLRRHWQEEHTIVICTARVLSDHDYTYFMENDIPFHHMLSRPMGCTMGDADLKDIQLRIFAQNQGYTWTQFCNMTIMYDDALSVLTRMATIGIDVMDATKQNRLLRWAS